MMKKLLPLLFIALLNTPTYAQVVPVAVQAAKILPGFEFGVKAGTNLTTLTTSGTLNSSNQAGYLGGFWARAGIAGILFQPEVYLTGKVVSLNDINNGQQNTVKFTSIDVPLLVGKHVGLLGIGARFYTGPVISFVVDKNQSLSGAFNNITKFDYKNQATALQFGIGADLQKLSADLRYELGLSSLSKDGYPDTKISMFNLSIAYRLF